MWNRCGIIRNLKAWNYVEYQCGINDACVEGEHGIMWNIMLQAWKKIGYNLGQIALSMLLSMEFRTSSMLLPFVNTYLHTLFQMKKLESVLYHLLNRWITSLFVQK